MDEHEMPTAPDVGPPPDHATYLRSAAWRRRRNRALRVAGWQCQRCGERLGLVVHHRTYDHVGAELDRDLEVLCRSCHAGHHFTEARTWTIGVYIRLVAACLTAGEALADLSEAVKVRCARYKIPYHSEIVGRAIAFIEADRRDSHPIWPLHAEPSRAPVTVTHEPPPITREEATQILSTLGARVQAMPAARARDLDPVVAARVRAARIVAREIVASIARCEQLEQEPGEEG